MKILVVENEKIIREGLVDLLHSLIDDLKQIEVADGIEASHKILDVFQPDLVFLDIELSDGTGIDLLNSLDKIDFQIIFMTAHDKYAINAFQFSACDFLLKPMDPDKLLKAVEKARKNIDLKQNQLQLELLKEVFLKQTQGIKPEKLILKDKQSMYVVLVSDIIRLEAENVYTTFFLKNEQQIVVSKNMKEYQDLLEDKGFVRVHQSHMVNLDCILKYDRINMELQLHGGNKVPVAHRKKEMLIELLSKL